MSSILASIIKKKTPDWNLRVWTEDDLDLLSQRFKVPMLLEESAKAKGEYVVIENIPMILLKPNLKPITRLWVGLHEFGHHLLHYPVNHRFSKGTRRRLDREANFFAAIGLIPTFLIKEKDLLGIPINTILAEIAEEYGYPKDLLKIRKEIYETYKI